MPNLETLDLEGKRQDLWEYRQKSQVVLILDPGFTPEAAEALRSEIEGRKKLWTWLNVKFVRSAGKDEALEPGAYLIDLYGRLIRFYPGRAWKLDEIEQDTLYNDCNC